MAGYVYRGVKTKLPPLIVTEENRGRLLKKLGKRSLPLCGTANGYRRHIREGEEACEECKRASADYTSRRKYGRAPLREYSSENCGTHSGYEKHRRNGERACQDCYEAERNYRKEKRLERGLKIRGGAECGTYAGYNQHRREGTEICNDCREATRLYRKALREKKR